MRQFYSCKERVNMSIKVITEKSLQFTFSRIEVSGTIQDVMRTPYKDEQRLYRDASEHQSLGTRLMRGRVILPR